MLEEDPGLAEELAQAWRAKYVAGKGARAHINLTARDPFCKGHDRAITVFAALTLHPDCERLSGPCANARCGKFFIRKGKRVTGYCSRKCNQHASAVRHRREKLAEDRCEKLARARRSIGVWQRSKTTLSWKAWIARRDPDITPRFLTRAVNLGDLEGPLTPLRS
jgi:hypothetical protein